MDEAGLLSSPETVSRCDLDKMLGLVTATPPPPKLLLSFMAHSIKHSNHKQFQVQNIILYTLHITRDGDKLLNQWLVIPSPAASGGHPLRLAICELTHLCIECMRIKESHLSTGMYTGSLQIMVTSVFLC